MRVQGLGPNTSPYQHCTKPSEQMVAKLLEEVPW